jgi:diguanylate cyclase (GGDEF)-like protein
MGSGPLCGPRRTRVWTQAVPFYAALPVIGLLGHASGGPPGYAPLALLPVLWLAVHFGRRELLLGLGVLAATFVTPLVLLEGASVVGGWRLAILLVVTGGVIGFTTCDLTDQLRHRAADLRAIGRAARELPADDSAREAACRVAREVSGADLVLLLEPDRRGWRLHATASDGVDLPVSIPMGSASAAVEAFRSRSARFVADCARRPSAGEHLYPETGAVSLYAQPVVRREAVVGVLVLGFRSALSRLPERLAECVDVIAAEASLALERADLLVRLASAAHTDGLTGAANRRGWELAVHNDLVPATGTPRVLALLDLDHFKRYNDTFGHQAGDELLSECVQRWRDVLRAEDTLARWGGEEFAVLLPGCDLAQAGPILDRLRACVPSGCTVSAGVTMSYGGEPPAAVMARADAALYSAKGAGRDRTVWHETTIVDLLGRPVSDRV